MPQRYDLPRGIILIIPFTVCVLARFWCDHKILSDTSVISNLYSIRARGTSLHNIIVLSYYIDIRYDHIKISQLRYHTRDVGSRQLSRRVASNNLRLIRSYHPILTRVRIFNDLKIMIPGGRTRNLISVRRETQSALCCVVLCCVVFVLSDVAGVR